MSTEAEWNDYWQSVAEGYKASKSVWAKHTIAAIKEHGDYADFAGFEKWMDEASGCGCAVMDARLTPFAAVWDTMDIHERSALYALFNDALAPYEKAEAPNG